jgi:hypothetical protein
VKKCRSRAVLVSQLLDKGLTYLMFLAHEHRTLLCYIIYVHCALITSTCVVKYLSLEAF